MSNDRDSWRTPPELYDWAERLVGGFQYDAACTKANALSAPLWERTGFKSGDSLSHAWPDGSTIWMNPPYSDIDPWLDRALECTSLVAMLIMSPNGESRFGRLLPRAHEINIVGFTDDRGRERSGRVSFIGPDGKPVNNNTRGSSLFLINNANGLGQRTFVTLDKVMGFAKEVA